MNEAVITAVIIDPEDGFTFTKVYRLQFEGDVHIDRDDHSSLVFDSPGEWQRLETLNNHFLLDESDD